MADAGTAGSTGCLEDRVYTCMGIYWPTLQNIRDMDAVLTQHPYAGREGEARRWCAAILAVRWSGTAVGWARLPSNIFLMHSYLALYIFARLPHAKTDS
jgi:hypothetical protein